VFDNPSEFARHNSEDFHKEKAFGQFIRLAFDYYAHPACNQTLAEICGVSASKDRQLKLVFATLNPSQMETLALLVCLDLGFIPEIGFANSLDHIDVRGRHPKKGLIPFDKWN
jgi:hypothetical protein